MPEREPELPQQVLQPREPPPQVLQPRELQPQVLLPREPRTRTLTKTNRRLLRERLREPASLRQEP